MSIELLPFTTYRKIGTGIDAGDPQDIDDTDCADALNTVFRNGFPETRKGSKLLWEKPTGETNKLLDIFDIRTSDGIAYTIAVYAPNFYLRDETNNQWILLNNSYTPSVTYKLKPYTYINWNNGKGKDLAYICNGFESYIKWQICFSTTTVLNSVGATSIVLTDSTSFPSSGKLIFQEINSAPVYAEFNANSANTLTLTAELASNVGAGATVTMELVEKSAMNKGSISLVWQQRLITANYFTGETVVSFSKTDDPETFTPGTGVTDGGIKTITDGNGSLTSIQNFGEYLLISKNDSHYKLTFKLDLDLATKSVEISPIVSDPNLGPTTFQSVIKKNNVIYFPTEKEGIFGIDPKTTGMQTSVVPTLVSKPIQSIIPNYSFTNCRGIAFNQYLLWTSATGDVNDMIWVLDLVNNAWSKFNSWNPQAWSRHNRKLIFGARTDDNIYEAFTDNYDDNGNSYEAYVLTKRWDFGHPSLLKTNQLIHRQGYLAQIATLNFDTMYNEGGKLQTITSSITGTDQLMYQPVTTAMAMAVMGLPLIGGSEIGDMDSFALMNDYYPTPIRYGWHNVQVKIWSNQVGAAWGLTGIGFRPEVVAMVPANLVKNDGINLTTQSDTSIVPTTNEQREVIGEIPSGAINGINKVYTFAQIPVGTTLAVYVDGIRVNTNDFSLLNKTLTLGFAPTSTISADYDFTI